MVSRTCRTDQRENKSIKTHLQKLHAYIVLLAQDFKRPLGGKQRNKERRADDTTQSVDDLSPLTFAESWSTQGHKGKLRKQGNGEYARYARVSNGMDLWDESTDKLHSGIEDQVAFVQSDEVNLPPWVLDEV